jgi:hypothetical protein
VKLSKSKVESVEGRSKKRGREGRFRKEKGVE